MNNGNPKKRGLKDEKIKKHVNFAAALEGFVEAALEAHRQHFSEKFGSLPFDLDG